MALRWIGGCITSLLVAALAVLAVLAVGPCLAQGTAPAAGSCPTTVAMGAPTGSLKVASSTLWQPVGGDFHFTLTELAGQPDKVSVWFNWQAEGDQKSCVQSTRVQFISKSSSLGDPSKIEYVYSARLPALDHDASSIPWIEGIKHWRFENVVPLADITVQADLKDDKGVAAQVLAVRSVGISTAWISFVFATGFVGVAWGVLVFWAGQRGVSGGALLGVISTPYGVASLSQFQILLWSTVIGAGVIYVMMISGNLIDIPSTTLALLGITGFTLVGSKIQAKSDGSPQRLSAPGVTANLKVVGAPTADTVVLDWSAPVGAEQPLSFTVQMRLAGAGSWSTVAANIGAPPYAVSGLTPGSAYDFQVFAMNSAGAGPASPAVSAATPPSGAAAGGRPGQVTGLTATAHGDGTVELAWAALNPAAGAYVVQYRAAGSLPWATSSNTANTPYIVRKLTAASRFEFLVFAVTGGAAGAPSSIAEATTATRKPKWSDLVMSNDGNVEIDLTRVQMLLFTSIAAAFTAMTLVDTGEIPDIPIGVLTLVGLSNGVYLASKAVGPSR